MHGDPWVRDWPSSSRHSLSFRHPTAGGFGIPVSLGPDSARVRSAAQLDHRGFGDPVGRLGGVVGGRTVLVQLGRSPRLRPCWRP